uniref:Uncharacterized protein n=1 Tax=Neogobius melanostomus TaxID=47308 RepID=A0A8C6TP81_9GOBI
MTDNFLQLNSSKTEGLLIGTPHQLRSPPITVYSFAGHDIPLTSSVTNLGVRFDPHLSFNTHIQHIYQIRFKGSKDTNKKLLFKYLKPFDRLGTTSSSEASPDVHDASLMGCSSQCGQCGGYPYELTPQFKY